MRTIILHGNIIHTPTMAEFECHPDSYLICQDNKIEGIYSSLPEKYHQCHVLDYGDQLIIPGLCDMHVHAPQFVYRGLGLDLQLMDWLNRYAFPTEARFQDTEYARIYYDAFAEAMAKNGTTRAVIFGTLHVPATELLMEILEKKQITAYVGKINMDTLSPDFLCETPEQSLADTEQWILATQDRFHYVRPAITPRFIPTCSSTVLQGLGRLAEKYQLPIHSHISEDIGEMEVVRGRYPEYDNDGDVYDSFGLLTDQTVMAHFIYPTDHELQLIRDRGVTIAHCPQSNGNVAAGIPPIRRMLDMGIKVGLGSDIAGGYSLCIFRAMAEAVYLSKLNWLKTDKKEPFLTIPEAFYLGTKGGGQFFGKAGSFETGYELDALVIDDRSLGTPADHLTLEERLERVIHLADDRNITARFTAGEFAG
ncbi:MAG: amidohydrolase family protein [Candidatus Choladocola sp.]|nr:amidohydrolase family protein [Candidatus Choladocola sp.]